MEILIIIVMIICFLFSLWFLIADLNGPIIWTVGSKILGVLGTFLPLIYFLKVLNIL